MSAPSVEAAPVYRFNTPSLVIGALSLLLTFAAFHEGIDRMVNAWLGTDEYSHGILIPFIAAFLVWQRRGELARIPFEGSWGGVAIVALGAILNLVGKLASVFAFQQYAMVVVIAGLIVAFAGWAVLKKLWVPVFILLFMVPIPNFFLNELSSQLQLISSKIGVAIIRAFGISVLLNGNVIDLGAYKLEVAEACSGLRYLFPLMTLGFLMAYFFKAEWWKRATVFFSSIPITILMNSARIGLIGITVDRWGTSMAEGFLHEFQGWAIFMLSAGVLVGEIVLLARLGRDPRPWRQVFGIELPGRSTNQASSVARAMPHSFLAAGAIVALAAGFVWLVPTPTETVPAHDGFDRFPAEVGAWRGHRGTLEKIYVDTLKFDDYVLSDYTRSSSRAPVNFYVAWYDSQRAGQSAHSPRSCLPGGGWRIQDLTRADVGGVDIGGTPLAVNRAIIQQGDQRELVYYWFQQRGRIVTNEYLVKWYLFWDSLTRHRTDGALVRLVTPIAGDIAEADARLKDFLEHAAPSLPRYIPG
jgi:exosortase D (VPLPA-CTERM-specific)